MKTIAHWWNRTWGWGRRDIWLTELDDGRFEVRWRGGDFTRRDGVLITSDWEAAKTDVETLMDDAEAERGWKEVSGS